MVNDQAFVEGVLSYYRKTAGHEPPVVACAMMELAPGVVAVSDNHDEIDTVFDFERWGFTHPGIWEGQDLPQLNELGMNILPGVGTLPQPRTFEEALAYAKRHLVPKATENWNQVPVKIEVS